MIFEQPFQPIPWVPKEIHTYADVVRFSQEMFMYFNGRVNPHFPARDIMMGHTKKHTVQGRNVGDVVVVYPHNILRFADSVRDTVNNEPYKVSCILKGIVLYTIIHELLHMEQDFKAYHDKYGIDDIYHIEEACHIMTCKYMDYLYSSQCYAMDIDPEIFECFSPAITSFLHMSKRKANKLLKQADSIFYAISDPIQKALYFWDTMLGGTFEMYSDNSSITGLKNPETGDKAETILMNLYIDRKIQVNDMYIKYAGKWMPLDVMMSIPRSLIIIEGIKGDDKIADEDFVKISSRISYPPASPSTICFDVSVESRDDQSLFDIVYRIPKDLNRLPAV